MLHPMFKRVILFFSLSIAPVAAVELPKTMAAFGDSMTEALLARYALEKGLPNAEYVKMLKIAAMEEELRLDAFRKEYGHRELSWATGVKFDDLVESHAERLKKHIPDLRAWNFSISGARSHELHKQVSEMKRVVEHLEHGFDYVVMLIGNNDMLADQVSDFIDPQVLKMNVEMALEEILRDSPRAKVLLSGPPEIFEIFDASNGIEALKFLRMSVKCQELRKTLYGDKVIFRPENETDYEEAKNKLIAYRDALRSLPDEMSWRHPEAEIRFVEIPRSEQRAKKVLSVDCFHPSEWGQAELANATWKKGFWPNL